VCPPFVFDTDVPNPEYPDLFIGKHYDSLHPPAGLKWSASGLLENENRSWARVEVQGRDIYFIQKFVCRDATGGAFWEVADAIALPLLDTRAHEVITDLCFDGNTAIPFVVAYGTYDPSKKAAPVVNKLVGWSVDVKSAWMMKEIFMPLDPKGLTCMFQQPQSTQ
jgi:hypothetical protein